MSNLVAVWEKAFKSDWEKQFSKEYCCAIKVALYASNEETKFEKEIFNKECSLLLNFDVKYLSPCMIICVDLKILFYAKDKQSTWAWQIWRHH